MALPFEFKTEIMVKDGRVTQKKIQDIKKWVQTTSLPELQEEFIALFLLSCGDNVEDAKNTIQQYFRIKSEGPEIFMQRDIDSEVLLKAMNVIICCDIPARMPNNTAVHLFRLSDTNYKNFDLTSNIKLSFMLGSVSQRFNPPTELVVIFDTEGVSLMHVTCLKLSAVKKYMEFTQEALPLKIKAIHILNANYVFEKILALAKMFMKSELLSLIVTHPPNMNMEEFHEKWVPASCLPKEYGGDLPCINELNQMTLQQFRELKDFYQKEENLIQKDNSNN